LRFLQLALIFKKLSTNSHEQGIMAVSYAAHRISCRVAICAALLAGLAGCAESVPGSDAIATAQAPMIRPSGFSPRPAALSVSPVEGAPAPLQSQFMALFNADAAQREVALTDSASARYLARGYISAFPVEGGAKLTYVWDIYDRTNHRAQRLNDEIALKGAAADPWSLVDGAALSALASRSARELAAYLSNTPEAMAQTAPAPAAPQEAPVAAATAPAEAMSYAAEH
jgi:hypothetical protein